MPKSRIINLLICFTAGCLCVVCLYIASASGTTGANAFIRKLPSHKSIGLGLIKLNDKHYYLAGIDSEYVYLGNWSKRNKILRINYNNKAKDSIFLSSLDTVEYNGDLFIRADNGGLYLFDGTKAAIVTGHLTNGKLEQIYKTPYFSTAVPLSKNTSIIRVVTQGRRSKLFKLNNGRIVKSYLLEKQGDGVFSTDGILSKTSNNSKLFYSYFYRNQFLCLDTNLKLLYRGKTIDTVEHASIKVREIKSMHETVLSAPPKFVNEQCAADKQFLFIHSALKADNEINETLKTLNPIDIYQIKDGKYLFSIYVANMGNEKLKDFTVYGKNLITIYDHYLYFYRLNF